MELHTLLLQSVCVCVFGNKEKEDDKETKSRGKEDWGCCN